MKKVILLAIVASTLSLFAWEEPVLDTNIRVEVDASGDTTFYLKKSWILQAEAEKLSDPIYGKMFDCVKTITSDEVDQIVPGSANNPANVKRVERLMPESDWEFLFPVRDSVYTYTRFLRAVGKFPAFCGDYDDGRDADSIARKCLATAFAHFTQETGGHDAEITRTTGIPEWRQGLLYIRELGCNEEETDKCLYNSECTPTDPANPTWQLKRWPCPEDGQGKFPRYYGRGAKQLSYHYNYGAFSEAMFGDPTILLADPDIVADTWLNLASAIFFFVTPRPPKPSMLHVIDGTWEPSAWDSANGILPNFGTTINIINGGVECGDSTTEKAQAINRMAYYQEFANHFGVPVPVDEELGCKDQVRFNSPLVRDSGGMAAYPVQWEPDYTWNDTRPYGNFECKGVSYETAYSAFRPGDYENCVTLAFSVDSPFPAERNRTVIVIDDTVVTSIEKSEDVDPGGVEPGVYVMKNPVPLDERQASIVVVTGEPALVQLSILDNLGQLVDQQTVYTEVHDATLFQWDLRSQSGNVVTPGAYMVYATMRYRNGRVFHIRKALGVKK